MRRGQNTATDKLSQGSKGPVSVDWRYSEDNRDWWKEFKNANFLGKLPPPPPPDPGTVPTGPVVVEKPVIPLENIIELAALVYDGGDEGKGELSHVVLRYKPEADVTPPEWYVRQTQSSPLFRGPGDGVPPKRAGGNQSFRNRNKRKTTPPPMPVATPSATLLLQKVWIKGGGDVRRDPHLWPPFEHIRLVSVAPSAQSAFFVREAPPPEEGAEPVEEKPEELFKTAANLSQEVLRALDALHGREAGAANRNPQATAQAANQWVESDVTTVVDNKWNIGREDEKAFQDDSFLEQVNFDTYVGRSKNSRRGLIVRNIDPQLAAKFGISPGEVLLSVNNRAVKTKAAAMQFGKKEYKKGVRTFVTKWLSHGQEIERVYQVPDKK